MNVITKQSAGLAHMGRSSRQVNCLYLLIPLICLVLAAAIGLYCFYGHTSSIPADANFLYMDPGWYISIRDHGYSYDAHATNNTAFFPLFPYLWRWLQIGPAGISIFNGALFVLSTFYLLLQFRPGWRTGLLYCAVSMLVFYMTPFAESLFGSFAVLLLVGLKRRHTGLSTIGILGAGLTRSAGMLFAPAFLLIAVYKWYTEKRFRAAATYFGYSAVSLLSVVIAFTVHWYQTGEFFAFSHTQQYWHNQWQSFGLPFSSWGPKDNQLYDQLALFICLLCIAGSIVTMAGMFRNKRSTDAEAFSLFSIFYYAGLGLLMLCTKGGEFNSISRYVFAAPFLFIIMHDAARMKRSPWQTGGIAFLGIAYFLICWHMGISLSRILQASLLLSGVLLFPLMLRRQGRAVTVLFMLMIMACLYIQGVLWFRYTTNVWVG